MSVMGIRKQVSAALGTYLNGIKPSRASAGQARAGNKSGNLCVDGCFELQNCGFAPPRRPRACTTASVSAAAAAQSGEPRPRTSPASRRPPAPADAAKDNQRKTDEFVEAAQAINGPAGNPECVWLGRRVVRLMWLDDLDTALPPPRSLRPLRLPRRPRPGDVPLPDPVSARQIDPKVPDTLNSRVHACWINPDAQPQAAAAATPPAPQRPPATRRPLPPRQPRPPRRLRRLRRLPNNPQILPAVAGTIRNFAGWQGSRP